MEYCRERLWNLVGLRVNFIRSVSDKVVGLRPPPSSAVVANNFTRTDSSRLYISASIVIDPETPTQRPADVIPLYIILLTNAHDLARDSDQKCHIMEDDDDWVRHGRRTFSGQISQSGNAISTRIHMNE